MPMSRLKHFLIVAATFIVAWSAPSLAVRAQTTVAMVQLASSDVGNFAKMKTLAQQAKAQGAQLVIFPEGHISRTNDRLTPMLEGTALIARQAAKKRAKDGGEFGVRNRMPYYFSVLRDLLGMKEDQASAGSPSQPG